ncbi:hypothetical protein L1987_56928 [Smallanthus sonchifolius]|uniref:Uncharacterized protein n=1 Tax=Smallanthus sonchifolius TaxID=185202 RepID=A0ACB9DC63_9ASTR|nr:hypothetical protein L1987_56928 [Smallanthus sonchifolius]
MLQAMVIVNVNQNRREGGRWPTTSGNGRRLQAMVIVNQNGREGGRWLPIVMVGLICPRSSFICNHCRSSLCKLFLRLDCVDLNNLIDWLSWLNYNSCGISTRVTPKDDVAGTVAPCQLSVEPTEPIKPAVPVVIQPPTQQESSEPIKPDVGEPLVMTRAPSAVVNNSCTPCLVSTPLVHIRILGTRRMKITSMEIHEGGDKVYQLIDLIIDSCSYDCD